MKTYKSHKVVQAAKIKAAEYLLTPGQPVHADTKAFTFTLEGGEAVTVDHSWASKHGGPDYGDLNGIELVHGYFVQYADGYTSWSPAEAFEEGYTELDGEAAPDKTHIGGTEPCKPDETWVRQNAVELAIKANPYGLPNAARLVQQAEAILAFVQGGDSAINRAGEGDRMVGQTGHLDV